MLIGDEEFPDSLGESSAAKPAASTKFQSVSASTAKAAKQGTVSASRTGRAKQASIEFGKPPKHLWVQVDPRHEYRAFNIPVYQDKDRDTTYYVQPSLYEGDTIPERFQRACTLVDIFTATRADGGFFLWTVNVSSSKWRKAALRAVESATGNWRMIEAHKPTSGYLIAEPEANEALPEPHFEKLGSFDSLLEQAFDGTINSANNEIVNRFMAGGAWEEDDE